VRVAVLGAGYVGACTAAVLAEQGHRVVLADPDARRAGAVRRGEAPAYEPGLGDAIAAAVRRGALGATTDPVEAVRGAELSMLCVGTPPKRDGSQDLRFVKAASRQVGQALRGQRGWHCVVTKSTVLPGTTGGVVLPAVEKASGRRAGDGFGVAVNPEFLREGNALEDARAPDRVVVGALDEASAKAVWALYEGLACPKLTVSLGTAEMIKYASNAFLATKVGFANEVANLCRAIGLDAEEVMQGVGLDARIGPRFLRAGAGFGGSCFPKDVVALLRLGERERAPSRILKAVLGGNARQPLEVVRLARAALGSLEGKRVALLGLAFKPDTDDVRETRALPIYRALRAAGARVVCYDPHAGSGFRALAGSSVRLAASLGEALDGADCAVVQTEWAEFRALPPAEFVARMRRPLVVDGRRTFDPKAMRAAGVEYHAIGLGEPARSARARP
jgi:UDPglucose 6-dehydrogenase